MLDNSKVRGAAALVVDPVARGLLRLGISPNQLTFFTALATSLSAICFWSRGEFAVGILVGLPFVVGDLLDGTMARISGQTSAFGGFLDSVMDRITDAAIFGSIIFFFASRGELWPAAAGLVAMAAGAVVPYARAKAESLGVVGKTGLMERSDRLLVVLLGALAAALGFEQGLAFAMYLLAPLTSFTVWQRMRAVYVGLSDAGR